MAFDVTLLGFVLPEDEFAELLAVDEGMPVQTQRFGLSLVQALHEGGATVSLLSAAPSTSFPHNPRRRFPTRPMSVGSSRGLELGFLNMPVLKHITRLGSVFKQGPAEIRLKADVLLIHGVHSPWLAFGVYSSKRLGVPAIAVMTDPPNVPHQFDTPLTRSLKKVDKALITSLLERLDGVVALTAPLAEDFAPGVPNVVMEGIAPEVPIETPVRPTSGCAPLVVYAGGLSEEYGVQLLLDAHALDPGAFRLAIAGRGPLEPQVRQRARTQENLEYLGLVAPPELASLYAEAEVLINPRPPGQGFTRYSFPSKILEYLAAGRPVVSTRLEGIPREYDEVLVWAEPTADGLRAALVGLLNRSVDDRIQLGRASAEFARTRSARAIGQRILSFLESVQREEASA